MELFQNSHVYTIRLNLSSKVVVRHLNYPVCPISAFLTFLFNSYCSLVYTEIKHYHNWIRQPHCHSCQKKQRLNGNENWITISVFRGISLGQNWSILVTALGSVYYRGACLWALSVVPYTYKQVHFLELQLWQTSLQSKCNIKLLFLSTSSTHNYRQTQRLSSHYNLRKLWESKKIALHFPDWKKRAI